MGNDAMKEKELKYFKELLTRWLDELTRHADRTMTGLREVDENLPDPLDRAVFDSDRNFTLRIRDRESMLIKKIRKSLEDIKEGVYGICESCGEDISVERLKARPVTHHCITKTFRTRWTGPFSTPIATSPCGFATAKVC